MILDTQKKKKHTAPGHHVLTLSDRTHYHLLKTCVAKSTQLSTHLVFTRRSRYSVALSEMERSKHKTSKLATQN